VKSHRAEPLVAYSVTHLRTLGDQVVKSHLLCEFPDGVFFRVDGLTASPPSCHTSSFDKKRWRTTISAIKLSNYHKYFGYISQKSLSGRWPIL